MKRQAGADRRGFLAMLGLGVAAGPSAAETLVKGHSFNALGKMVNAVPDYGDEDDIGGDDNDDNSYEIKRGKNKENKSNYHKRQVQSAVEDFNKTKSSSNLDDLPNFIRQVNRLDHDLLVNRSLSVYARVRLQALRNLEASHASNLSYKEKYIHNAVRRARSYLSDNECFDLIASNIIRDKTKPLPTMEAFLKVIGPRRDK